ncbi:glycosyltransferase family 39 protein [Pseudomonas sp. 10B1]|uniref:glycosyltransferase family 39 protein n=1 Tax=unclassified Pseudomonas TaxID=196821 RepID=UPI002AB5D010|nr:MULTISPECIES: glycosyltransferase family 39 protein [unclassified Pseudomonas]MDY7561653.1 glycosyltransferase family 39 protein [Pseudomonas sp. AB6]MEA9978198.1 glycosyltransferase family 39 protein [Pseudomonas sp. RTS4]MEA9994617.1 glycosyltransferase family 39 protein [Pseudomonas sp. AA4]MEB0085762.1 glycosyltransferase family 39 protein [Pseudomonas sp. RTI1]MEB0125913.1 glycosyltransferase family 39 protein [Pseudomonas sp. CCC1.2]
MELLLPHKAFNTRRVTVFVREHGLLPILMLALLARLYNLTSPTVWYDEAFSALISAYSPTLIWHYSGQDVHPPLYYLLLHGWIVAFGNGVFAIRAMSVLAGVVSVALAHWLVRLIATQRAAIWAGLLLALLPIAVRYSQEVRMYALMGVWLMGATIALVYWVQNPLRQRYSVIYVVLMTAAFYTHYFAALCVLSHWLYVSVGSKQGRLVLRLNWWVANAAIVVCFLPWITRLIGQLSHTAGVDWIPPPTLNTLPSVIWQFLTLNDGLGLPWPLFLGLPLMVVVATLGIVIKENGPLKFHSLIALYTVAPLCAVLLISFKLPLFATRYFVFSALGLPIILAIALDHLAQRYRRIAVGCLMALVALEGVGLYNCYTQNNKLNDSIGVLNNRLATMVEELNLRFRPGDQVVVYGLYWYLSVLYYNKNQVQPLLYTPPTLAGLAARPGMNGAGTLFYQQQNTYYLDRLSDLDSRAKRVWLLYGSAVKDYVPVPSTWHAVSVYTLGNTQLRLYAVGRDIK